MGRKNVIIGGLEVRPSMLQIMGIYGTWEPPWLPRGNQPPRNNRGVFYDQGL